MKKSIEVQYRYTNAIRVIVTVVLLSIYNSKSHIFGIYILYLLIFSKDKYKISYDKKIYPIMNVIIGYVMYAGMLYIIFPIIKDEDSIFFFILGILILKKIYVPKYKVE